MLARNLADSEEEEDGKLNKAMKSKTFVELNALVEKRKTIGVPDRIAAPDLARQF